MLCCRGFCAASARDTDAVWADFDFEDDTDEGPSPAPLASGLLSFSGASDQPLRGEPVMSGRLWYISADGAEPVDLSLHVNGFAFQCSAGPMKISISPFSLIRTCKMQGVSCSGQDLGALKIFKVSLFAAGLSFFFGAEGRSEAEGAASVSSSSSEEERTKWVTSISHVVRQVTRSLFRPFSISCAPLPRVKMTADRLMAGYVLHHGSESAVDLVYCELQCHRGGEAKLVLYTNELCHVRVSQLRITESTACCERIGVDCCCFCVADDNFSVRTSCERRLWLRAISNVKVKLRNEAPEPTAEELECYREAIAEYVSSISEEMAEGSVAMDPLLQRLVNDTGPIARAAPLLRAAGADVGPLPAAARDAVAGRMRPLVSADRFHDGDSAGGAALPLGSAKLRDAERRLGPLQRWRQDNLWGAQAQADAGAGSGAPEARGAASKAETHVLIVAAVAGESSDESGRRCLDGAQRLESWCRRCGIDDITLLSLSVERRDAAAALSELRAAIKALCARCRPGDACVLQLSGLQALGVDGVTGPPEPETSTSTARLPAGSTLVVVADAPDWRELAGLEAQESEHCFVWCVLGAADRDSDVRWRPEVTASAMLRAADALSLADGPCALTCADFFEELSEQVREMTACTAGSPSPQITLGAQLPSGIAGGAGEVPWPLAARSRSLFVTGGEGSSESSACRRPLKQLQQTAQASPLKGAGAKRGNFETGGAELRAAGVGEVLPVVPMPRATEDADPVGAAVPSALPDVPSLPGGGEAAEADGAKRPSGSSGGERTRRRSGLRGMPTDLGGLSALLTGGGFRRNSSASAAAAAAAAAAKPEVGAEASGGSPS
eukprot:TRINITY_DN64010_c0_g1_i1.p1 TRINITY_DN64010_c0_g1~~TRINITY_DN64010_c0_g1_i1.p1  ORF type:complete len:841 (-),score=187.78 TRINITY_DN64010_c0_g1_i1:81-2603(-)